MNQQGDPVGEVLKLNIPLTRSPTSKQDLYRPGHYVALLPWNLFSTSFVSFPAKSSTHLGRPTRAWTDVRRVYVDDPARRDDVNSHQYAGDRLVSSLEGGVTTSMRLLTA